MERIRCDVCRRAFPEPTTRKYGYFDEDGYYICESCAAAEQRPAPRPVSRVARKLQNRAGDSQRNMVIWLGFAGVLVFLLVAGVVVQQANKTLPPAVVSARIHELMAKSAVSAAQEFVLRNLKAPKTAEFVETDRWIVEEYEPEHWCVSGYVDSQNGFGVFIRGGFYVAMRHDVNGWKLVSVNIE